MSKTKFIKHLALCFAVGISCLFPVTSSAAPPVYAEGLPVISEGAETKISESETSFFSKREKSGTSDFPTEVIPGGEAFGVKFKAAGVLVTDRRDAVTEDKSTVNPAFDAGVRKGDIITEIDGVKIKSGADFRNIVAQSGGKTAELTLIRNGNEQKLKVTPVLDTSDGEYHIGVVVKDSTAGLGTITFYDAKKMTFGALGHGICEGETSTLFPLEEGSIYSAQIYSVVKGVVGTPGELRGLFLDETVLGQLSANTERGVCGTVSAVPGKETLKVADEAEISEGEVTIFSSIDEGGVKGYSAKITKIDMSEKDNRNFVITVTDARLLEKTGGIVQGMSGSPIIQNGKIIGAVTHVFINDPTSGYGIYIKNMPLS